MRRLTFPTFRSRRPPIARQPARSLGHRFLRNETGASAVELAFVLPILLLVLTGIIQFGAIFFIQNHMGDVARDAARRVSVGQMDAAAGQLYAEGKLINWSATFTVLVQDTTSEVAVDISAPLSEISLVDIFGLFQSGTLRAHAEMPR